MVPGKLRERTTQRSLPSYGRERMRVNGNPLQPVLGVERFATRVDSAESAVGALNALMQNAQVHGAMPSRRIQSTRDQRPPSPGFNESFRAMKYWSLEFHLVMWYFARVP
jgi:hypothetical protein